MTNNEFVKKAKDIVVKYFNKNVEKSDNFKIKLKDVYIVWICKTLQNNKALLSTIVSDGMYYEVTYNGDKDVFYFDAYKKWFNKEISNKRG